jgi:hypothetical protein
MEEGKEFEGKTRHINGSHQSPITLPWFLHEFSGDFSYFSELFIDSLVANCDTTYKC